MIGFGVKSRGGKGPRGSTNGALGGYGARLAGTFSAAQQAWMIAEAEKHNCSVAQIIRDCVEFCRLTESKPR